MRLGGGTRASAGQRCSRQETPIVGTSRDTRLKKKARRHPAAAVAAATAPTAGKFRLSTTEPGSGHFAKSPVPVLSLRPERTGCYALNGISGDTLPAMRMDQATGWQDTGRKDLIVYSSPYSPDKPGFDSSFRCHLFLSPLSPDLWQLKTAYHRLSGPQPRAESSGRPNEPNTSKSLLPYLSCSWHCGRSTGHCAERSQKWVEWIKEAILPGAGYWECKSFYQNDLKSINAHVPASAVSSPTHGLAGSRTLFYHAALAGRVYVRFPVGEECP